MNTTLARIQDGPLNDHIIDVRGYANEMTIEVKADDIFVMLQSLKEQFGFNYLVDITAADHYTDKGRFELCYNIVNLTDKARLRISCRLEEDKPEIDSVIGVWGSAEWYEREAFDMMGITFRNHPDLRRIYMPEDFEYFPLRKEFPQLGLPGTIELPEKDAPNN
ncbi:MAG: NADH-quinone oxidoreductase subunit C [Bacteroidia bacterium]